MAASTGIQNLKKYFGSLHKQICMRPLTLDSQSDITALGVHSGTVNSHHLFFLPASCWLKNDVAFYVAVVAYFCVIFVFNLIMFVVVLVQLCRIKRQNPHNSTHRTTVQDVRSVAGITVLLGLTWGFAFFAWGPVNTAFMYLFAIFNSLQGQRTQAPRSRASAT